MTPAQTNTNEETGAFAAAVLRILENLRRLYELDKNPLHAWSAYRFARGRRLPIPEWVLGYFDDCDRGLLQLAETMPPRKERLILAARSLGLVQARDGRGPDAFDRYDRKWENLYLLVLILRLNGHTYEKARAAVARTYYVSGSTIDRAWRTARTQEPSFAYSMRALKKAPAATSRTADEDLADLELQRTNSARQGS